MMNAHRAPSRALAGLALLAFLGGCATVQDTASRLWPFGGNAKAEAAKKDDGRISILTFDQKLEADPAIAALPISLPAATINTSWPTPGGGLTNAPGHPAASSALSVAWKRSAGQGGNKKSPLVAPPIIADGRIYVLDSRSSVRALDERTGAPLWSASLAPAKVKRPDQAMGGGLTFDAGKLFAATGFGEILALDPATGAVLWRTKGTSPFHASPSAADGKVFATSNDGELLALTAATGATAWNFQAIPEPARVLSSPSAAISGEVIISPFASGEIVALLTTNGRRLWADALTRAGNLTSLGTINDIAGRPVVTDGKVYAASQSGIIAAIDIRTGDRVWERTFASIQTPYVIGDFIYAVSTAGELVCLTRTTGGVRWVKELQRYKDVKGKKGLIAWAGPIMAGGNLVLANSLGDVVIIDPLTGDISKSIKVGAPVYIAPFIANETVYVLNDKAELTALR